MFLETCEAHYEEVSAIELVRTFLAHLEKCHISLSERSTSLNDPISDFLAGGEVSRQCCYISSKSQ